MIKSLIVIFLRKIVTLYFYHIAYSYTMQQIIAGRLLTRSWKPDLQASLGHLVQLLQPLCAGEREINKKVTSLWHSSSPWFPFCHYLLTLVRFHFFHGTPKFFSYRDSPKWTKLDHTPNQKIVSLLIIFFSKRSEGIRYNSVRNAQKFEFIHFL